jgi:hypothetical protein
MLSNALAPMLALILWTLCMLVWMYATRLPAMAKLKVAPAEVSAAGALRGRLPASVTRIADNYNHLHEQPTLFYALCAFVVLADRADAVSVALLWAYVGLRIAHSLVQATVNHVPTRFVLFNISSVCLAIIAVREAVALF